MITIDLPSARRLAFMCARAQLVVTLLAAAVSVAVAGPRAGWSALVGGGASTLASVAMALLAFGRLAGSSPERMLLAFYVGEFAKIAVVIAVLVSGAGVHESEPGGVDCGLCGHVFGVLGGAGAAVAVPTDCACAGYQGFGRHACRARR